MTRRMDESGNPLPHVVASKTSRVEFRACRLCANPLIFIASASDREPIGPVSVISPSISDRPMHALLMLGWSLENPPIFASTVAAYRAHIERAPLHRVTFLTNTDRERELLEAEGMPAILCNHNCFVDERVFAIDPSQEKEFDAVYVGVMNRFKRHGLCRDVPRVALIYYDLQSRSEQGYFAELKASLTNAVFVNEQLAAQGHARPAHPRAQALIDAVLKQHRHVNLTPPQVATWISRSRVGLCLSAEEGAMRASMEYLLCGIPVVSTHNRGGRDFFFHPDYSATVDADPRAIASAVSELSRRAPPAEEIRARALAQVVDVRLILRDALREAFAAQGLASRVDTLWDELVTKKSFGRWTLEDFLTVLR